MKRVLAILITIAMLFSMAACTVSEEENVVGSVDHEYTTGYDETKYNEPGTFPIFKEKQTITLTLPDSASLEDYNTNLQTLMYKERMNADFVFNALPSKEYNTKINLMTAAGGDEFGDAILGSFGDGMVMNLAEAEVIVPLTEYFYNTDISYYIQDAKKRLEWDFYPYITMYDGEIYGIPGINDSISNISPDKMWLYKPWFDAAGVDLTAIKTPQDFKDALLKVVKSDPNGNGKADEVGISGYASSTKWRDWVLNAFVYAGGDNRLYVKDGKVGFAFLTDEWREGLKYIKDLYDNGLVDPLSYSQDRTGFKAMMNSQDVIVTAFSGTATNDVSGDNIRRVEYEGIAPLNSSWNNGKPLSTQTLPQPTVSFLISKNAKDVETVFRFGDFMVSEESSVHTRWGQKGKDWLVPGENDKSMYEALGYEPYLIEVLPYGVESQNSHWESVGPEIRHKAISAGVVWSGNPYDQNRKIAEAQVFYNGTGPEEDIVKIIYTEEENEIVSEVFASAESYVNESATQFIMGVRDIDTEWDAYISQLESMNVYEALECVQTAYDRMK